MRTAAINHDRRVASRTRLGDGVGCLADVLGGKVWTFCAAAQDDVHVLISARLDDGGDALFGDAHERMRVAAGTHRVDGDGHAAVRTVLEADREGDARREFAMELRLGGARANGAPRNKVVEILRRYGVEELRADGDAEMGKIAEKLPGDSEAVVDPKRPIDGRVVDEALPTNCRARLLLVRKKKKNGSRNVREKCASGIQTKKSQSPH